MSNLLVQKDLTVTAGAYSANDCIGGLQSVQAGRIERPSDKVIHAVTITDKSQQKAAMNLIIFRANPDGSTLDDNTACDVVDADLSKVIGYIAITASDYIDFADNSVATVTAQGLPIDTSSDQFYYALQAVGTPTYVATTDIAITISML